MKLSIVFTALLAGIVTAAPFFVDCETEADRETAAATGLRCRNKRGDNNANANANTNGNNANANNSNGNDANTNDDNGNDANTNGNANGLPLFPAGQGDAATNDAIAQLIAAFDRNNPNGTPAAPGDKADLNGDGVINLFEAGAQAS
ncbi:hypothetical protein AAE478_002510 [Parahypoxylon ruwenzoriense]